MKSDVFFIGYHYLAIVQKPNGETYNYLVIATDMEIAAEIVSRNVAYPNVIVRIGRFQRDVLIEKNLIK